MYKESANPINTKGIEKIIAKPIQEAFRKLFDVWYGFYIDESDTFADNWEPLSPWTLGKYKRLGVDFEDLYENYFWGLDKKTIGEYLKGKDVKFFPKDSDWQKESSFRGMPIVLGGPDKLGDSYFTKGGGRPRIFIKPWEILKDMPEGLSYSQALRVLNNILEGIIGHELIHALDYLYKAENVRDEDTHDPHEKPHEYYNSPHELRAYVYNAAQNIWNSTLPQNRHIQRFIGKYLWEALFGGDFDYSKYIAPDNRRAFAQRVSKQLLKFQEDWIKDMEAKNKKSSYSDIDEDYLQRHSIDPDELGWLGKGANGSAYEVDEERVLKITRSRDEYEKAKSLIGKNYDNLITIYEAEQIGSEYYILMENLDMDSNEESLFYEALGVIGTQGLPVTYISNFDVEEYEEENGEIPEDVLTFINELENVVYDLRRAGVGDTADVHADNLGRDKNTGALKAFDIMEKS